MCEVIENAIKLDKILTFNIRVFVLEVIKMKIGGKQHYDKNNILLNYETFEASMYLKLVIMHA